MSSSPTCRQSVDDLLRDLDRKLDMILEELTKVRTDLQEIRNEVQYLSGHVTETLQPGIDELQKSANRMNAHIDLVDGVYNKVKVPFLAVMDYAGTALKSNAVFGEPQAVDCETTDSGNL